MLCPFLIHRSAPALVQKDSLSERRTNWLSYSVLLAFVLVTCPVNLDHSSKTWLERTGWVTGCRCLCRSYSGRRWQCRLEGSNVLSSACLQAAVPAVLSGALRNLQYHNVQYLIRGTCAILHVGILCSTLTYLKICALSRYVALCTYFYHRVGGFQVETSLMGTPGKTHGD